MTKRHDISGQPGGNLACTAIHKVARGAYVSSDCALLHLISHGIVLSLSREGFVELPRKLNLELRISSEAKRGVYGTGMEEAHPDECNRSARFYIKIALPLAIESYPFHVT